MAVKVKTGPTFEVGAVEALFQTRPSRIGVFYDVSTDGQRFVIATLQSEEVSPPLTLVLNWTADLKK